MRNFNPKTVQDNETLITRTQEGFGAGMFDDIPGSQIPKNGVKYSENYKLYRDRAEPRGGCRKWGKWSTGTAHASLPLLRTGYSLTKSGTTVTKTAGDNFTSSDVGNYVVYDDGKRERIDAYINGSQVTMDRDTAHSASTAAAIMGPINLIKQHKVTKKVILHIDTRVFISDIYMTTWFQCYNVTPEFALDSSVSIFDEKDNWAFLYNPTGTFKINLNDLTDLTNNPPIYFKINTPVPLVKVTDVATTDSLPYIRKYLYYMTRLSGDGADRDRHSGVTIDQISGPVAVDDDFKDYGSVATSRPIGLADTEFQTLVGDTLIGDKTSIGWWATDNTIQVLTGGDVTTSYDDASEWTGIADGEFVAEFDSYAWDITGMDFSSVTSMGSLDEQVSGSVAEVMENAIRATTSALETVRWDSANRRFILRSALNPDSSTTLSEITAGLGGTDISSISGLDSGSGATVSTETAKDTTNMQFRIEIDGVSDNVSFDSSGIETFSLLADVIESALQDVFDSYVLCNYVTNHFEITNKKSGGTVDYASTGDYGFDASGYLELDSGSASITSSPWSVQSQIGELTVPINTATGNKVPHWTHYSLFATLDVGVNGINSQTGSGNNSELFVWVGDFPVAKSFVCGRSANLVTAASGTFSLKDVGSTIKWQSGTEAVISEFISTTQVNTSTSGTITSQSACIGGGNVMTAAQTGTTVTRTSGDSFSVNDVGKTIFWGDGRRSVITEYTDADNVEASTSQTVSSQSATLDPVSRKINDTTEDATLRTRIGGYSLPNRFFQPLPNCNDGIIIGAFMWTAIRGEEKVYYSQIPAGESYMAGYYNNDLQVTSLKDKIVRLREFTDRLVIYCSKSTRGIPTNIFDTEKIPDIGEVVIIASGQLVIDHNIGLLDYGSVAKITHGRDRLITNEGAVRDFNGREYSQIDHAYNRIRNKLMKFENDTSSAYHRELGYVIWGLDE